MQQHSIKQKRKQLTIRYFTYGAMSLAVVLISAVCIMLALGYGFDFKQNTVVQRALVQFNSFPQGATITVDNQELAFRTPGKLNVDTGQHVVAMKLDGYREWTKSVVLDAGELRWLNYARLIPKTVTTNSVKEFALVSGNLPSPDRNWMAIYQDPAEPEITIADLRNPTKVKLETLAIPATAYTTIEGQPSNFQLSEWDFGARYLLVKHIAGDKVEYLRADRTGQEPVVNINHSLNIVITDIHFSGNSGNVFYVRDATDLRKIDLVAGTISSPIASQVSAFTLYKTDTISYVSDDAGERRVGVRTSDKHKADLRKYDTTQPVLTAVSSYFSDTYVAVVRGTSIEVIKNPFDKDTAGKPYVTVSLPVSASWLQFSNSGRFIVAGTGTQYVTYDLETKETFSVNLPGRSVDNSKPLRWLDDYSLVSTVDQNLRVSEFDGGNQQVITDVAPELAVTLSDDYKYLFSVSKTTDGYALQASKMTTGN